MNQSICNTNIPSGISPCSHLQSPIENIFFAKRDVVFLENEIEQEVNWEEKIAADLSIYIPSLLLDYEDQSSDIPINNSNLLNISIGKRSKPGLIAYFDSNSCDFLEWRKSFFNSNISCFFLHADGSISGIENNDLSVRGYTVVVNAINNEIPNITDPSRSFPLLIDFKIPEEFMKTRHFSPQFMPINLNSHMPAGYSLNKLTEYSGAKKLDVLLRERCIGADNSLSASDWEIINTSPGISDVEVTNSVNNLDGKYTLTIAKNVGTNPASLVESEYASVRVNSKEGGNTIKLSNAVQFYGGEALELDYVTGFPDGFYKWYSGLLAPNGYIYGDSQVKLRDIDYSPDLGKLKFNPVDDTYTVLPLPIEAFDKYLSKGVLAPNGCIYHALGKLPPGATPPSTVFFLKVDTSSDVITVINTTQPYDSTQAWHDGVLAQNGCIYFSPDVFGQYVCVFDPSDNSFEYIDPSSGSFDPGAFDSNEGSAILATNGYIYVIPTILPPIAGSATGSIVKIDVSDNTFSLIPIVFGDSAVSLYEATLLPDGRIFALRYGSSGYKYFIFDPSDDSHNSFPSSITHIRYKATLAIDGYLYITSFLSSESYIIRLDFLTFTEEQIEINMTVNNQYSPPVFGGDGSLYFLPLSIGGTVLAKLNNTGVPDPSINQIPANLNDLPTSDYNLYHNG